MTLDPHLPSASAGTASSAEPSPSQKLSTSPAQGAQPIVYVFRKHTSSAGRVGIEVYCDGVSLGKVQGEKYFTRTLSPGKHIFTSTEKQSSVELDAVSGGVYYIELSMSNQNAVGRIGYFPVQNSAS